ncbi:MAG: hypothetical protein ABFD89_28420 [Bryobacteraceae bacterium]
MPFTNDVGLVRKVERRKDGAVLGGNVTNLCHAPVGTRNFFDASVIRPGQRELISTPILRHRRNFPGSGYLLD